MLNKIIRTTIGLPFAVFIIPVQWLAFLTMVLASFIEKGKLSESEKEFYKERLFPPYNLIKMIWFGNK